MQIWITKKTPVATKRQPEMEGTEGKGGQGKGRGDLPSAVVKSIFVRPTSFAESQTQNQGIDSIHPQ